MIDATTPTTAAMMEKIFAFLAQSRASSIRPICCAVLILLANTIAGTPRGMQQQIVDSIAKTRYGVELIASPGFWYAPPY